MDFKGFLNELSQLKKNGWNVTLIESACPQFPRNHFHLQLRLKSTIGNEWLSPREAISYVHTGKKDADFGYADADISMHGLDMAADYIDWLESGYQWYAYARIGMLNALGISIDDVKKRAVKPRSFTHEPAPRIPRFDHHESP